MDFTAEQCGQIAGDGQTQTGAAITAVDTALALLKGFKNNALLIRCYTDAGVFYGERDTPVRGAIHHQRDAAALGEFECIRHQVFQDLLQALPVGDDGYRRRTRHLHMQRQTLLVGQRLEGHLQVLYQAAQVDVFRAQLQFARLHLGDVEDVVNQIQQVIAGGINTAGKLDLLLIQIALAVFGEDLRENHRAVQRCAQLVRHVGEKLRFVFARLLQLCGALFQHFLNLVKGAVFVVQNERLFHQLIVGLLQLRFLVFQQRLGFLQHARLFLQFFIGGAQLFLLYLQLFVQLLGLLQRLLQATAIERGFHRGADTAGNRFEKLHFAAGRRLQKAEFDNSVRSALVNRRQQNDMTR